jgi:hemoglobin
MNRMQPMLRLALCLALATSLASCHASAKSAPAAAGGQATLYTRLGGQAGIEAVAGQFVTNITTDSRISHYFVDTDVPQFKNNMSKLLAQLTGGPKNYVGRDMKTTHTGLGVSGADFDAVIEDLVKSLDQFKVGEKEKSELLGILSPLRKDIVEK